MKKAYAIQCFESSLGCGFVGNTYQHSSFTKGFTLLFDTESEVLQEVEAILNGERAFKYDVLTVVPVFTSI